MAFTYSIKQNIQRTGGRTVVGTYTNTTGYTGGTIKPGLSLIYHAFAQPKAASVVSSMPVINKTLPTGDSFVIVTTCGESGYWQASGV